MEIVRRACVSIRTITAVEDGAHVTGHGSGFVVKMGRPYVITAAHCVILPPNTPRSPKSLSVHCRVQDIFVQAYAVAGQDLIYRAKLVGLDGAGDIAVLAIDERDNLDLPSFNQIHTLEFARSELCYPGQPVYLVGDPQAINPRSTSSGVIRDSTYTDAYGVSVQELIATDANATTGNSGSPILDADGRVIGMNSFITESFFENFDFAAGPSSRFMWPVIVALTQGTSHPHVRIQSDLLGDFLIYVKGYLGVGLVAVDALGLAFKPDRCACKYEYAPLTRRQLTGLQVVEIDGGCGCNIRTSSPSPLLGWLEPGDLLLSINDLPIGTTSPQLTPSLITWRLLPGSRFTFTFRRSSEQYVTEHKGEAVLAEFPPEVDLALGALEHESTPTWLNRRMSRE